jgi:hypothetical protein
MRLKVTDHPELIKDSETKAILNVDSNSLNKYKEERDFKIKLARVVQEHEVIKSDLNEIKSLLLRVLEQR